MSSLRVRACGTLKRTVFRMALSLLGRKKTTVGLDVGSGLVKVCVVEHAKSGPELVRVAVVPLLPDAIVEGEIMDPGIVTDAIREGLATVGLKTPQVVTSVGGRDVIIKKIQVERVKEQQARELMRWEAEQYVPFDMESVELDFQILDPDGVDPSMAVLMVAAKRDLIEAKMRLLADAGVQPQVVDVEAFALHNAFELSYPEAMSGVVGLVNVGNEFTNINILDDGVPILTRDIGVGTKSFREDLQRDRGLGADEAAQMVQGYDRSPALDAAIESRGEELAMGVERAAAFLATNARASGQLRALWVCGGGARIPGLVEALGERLRLPVEQATPLGNLRVRDGAFGALVPDEVAPLLMLPIGLALRTTP